MEVSVVAPYNLVKEIRETKAKCERHILLAVYEAICVVEKETGLNVQGVRAKFHESTTVCDERKQFVVSEVEIELEKI
jgi:hypothetical protein